MKKVIIYGSCYGTAKSYAEELSKRTGIEIKNYKDVKTLDGFDEIIHVGSLYGGGVKGFNRTLRFLPKSAKLIIVTVGIADPSYEGARKRIEQGVNQTLTDEIRKRTEIVSLRGAIDYKTMSFTHRMMMKVLYNAFKNKAPKDDGEINPIVETYNKTVSFVDFDSLGKVIEIIEKN